MEAGVLSLKTSNLRHPNQALRFEVINLFSHVYWNNLNCLVCTWPYFAAKTRGRVWLQSGYPKCAGVCSVFNVHTLTSLMCYVPIPLTPCHPKCRRRIRDWHRFWHSCKGCSKRHWWRLPDMLWENGGWWWQREEGTHCLLQGMWQQCAPWLLWEVEQEQKKLKGQGYLYILQSRVGRWEKRGSQF